MTVGIIGGSFNPVHTAHLMLASWISQSGEVDEVWLTVSPHNPLKESHDLAPEAHRLAMVQAALADHPGRLRCCDIEMTMPRPSYTIDTLRHLRALYPMHRFRLIIGSDNWLVFDRWRCGQQILDEFGVIVYPRPGYPIDNKTPALQGVQFVDAPLLEVSSTMVRRAIAAGRDMRWFVPDAVLRYINTHNLYK